MLQGASNLPIKWDNADSNENLTINYQSPLLILFWFLYIIKAE